MEEKLVESKLVESSFIISFVINVKNDVMA